MKPYFVDEQAGITIYHANCLDLLPALCEAGFDAAITDPQYGIGENYASGHDSADDVTLALSVLALLRFSTKRIALTSGIRHPIQIPSTGLDRKFFLSCRIWRQSVGIHLLAADPVLRH